MSNHGPHCKMPYNKACREFSTDGTRLGADIAHTFGTTDEKEISATESIGTPAYHAAHSMTGMTAEQREWEGLDEYDAEDGDEEGDGDF